MTTRSDLPDTETLMSLGDALQAIFGPVFVSEVILTPKESPMNNLTTYLLVAFVFGQSKTNGIIYGTRQELPNKVKESKDFPGTYYKVVTDDHDQKQIYRYVALENVADFLEDTDTNGKVLPKVLTFEELNLVMAPSQGETWELEDGTRVIIAENKWGVCEKGNLYSPEEVIGERLTRTTAFNEF